MLAQAAQTEKPFQGVRRFDVLRDIGPVTNVIGTAFADDIGPSEGSILREFRMMQYLSPLLWALARTSPDFEALLGGFVWVEDNRVVGSVTLTRMGEGDAHWLISNVAVLPTYRRRGIARALMNAAIDMARARGATVLTLQVRHDNEAAYRLYADLGFRMLEQTATLERPAGPLFGLSDAALPWRSWGAADAVAAVDLARAVVPEAYQAMLPLRRSDYIPADLGGWAGRALDWLRGYQVHRLAVPDRDQFAASVVLKARMRPGAHHLELHVRPAWRGQLEHAAVAHALRLLANHGQRPIVAEIRTTEAPAIEALKAVDFRVTHVLDRLGLGLGPPRPPLRIPGR